MPNPSKAKRTKRFTIYDIAREAKVSTGTVSRALNNSDDVNIETRELVLGISRRMGVRPRATVKRTHLAVIVPARDQVIPGSFVDTFIYELLHELSIRGCALTAFTELQIDNLNRWIFDGVFCLNWQPRVVETLAQLRDTPVVAINRFQDQGRFHLVGWDHWSEGRVVAEHFLQRGHRRLAMVSPHPTNSEANIIRLKGFCEAAAAAGYPVNDEFVELLEDGSPLYSALQRVIGRGADAIFIPGQGRHAIEAMAILQNLMKVRVPEDVSLIGGESPGWSTIANPPLTTVHVSLSEVAKQAMEMMHEVIAKKPRQMAERRIAATILERKSVRNRPTGIA
jgi:LacI family transcriptional regulator